MIERWPPRVWLVRNKRGTFKVDQASTDPMFPGLARDLGKQPDNRVRQDILDS